MVKPALASWERDSRLRGRQDLARERYQRGQAEGLLQKRHVSLCEEALVLGMCARTGDDDKAPQKIGQPSRELPVEAHPVELRHAEIAEDEVIVPYVDLLEGQPAVAGQVDFVSFVGQYGGQHPSDGGIVFDHQDVQGSTVNLRHKIFPSKRRTRSQGKRIRSLSVGESELRPQNRHSLPKFQSSLLPARLATTGAKVPMYGSRTTK